MQLQSPNTEYFSLGVYILPLVVTSCFVEATSTLPAVSSISDFHQTKNEGTWKKSIRYKYESAIYIHRAMSTEQRNLEHSCASIFDIIRHDRPSSSAPRQCVVATEQNDPEQRNLRRREIGSPVTSRDNFRRRAANP